MKKQLQDRAVIEKIRYQVIDIIDNHNNMDSVMDWEVLNSRLDSAISKAISDAYQRGVEEGKEETVNKVDNMMDIERVKDLKENLKIMGHEYCPTCGYDPEHQRNYMLKELSKLRHNKKNL